MEHWKRKPDFSSDVPRRKHRRVTLSKPNDYKWSAGNRIV